MANKKYLRCDISFMKETNIGGRLYSGLTDKEVANGYIGYLGEYAEGSTEVRKLLTPTAELIEKGTPVIVMRPEINYDESRERNKAFGIHRNEANRPVPVIPFHEFDGVDLSSDYFDLTGKASGKTDEVEVGDIFEIQEKDLTEEQCQLKYVASPTGTGHKGHFKVIGVQNSHIPVYLAGDGNLFPKAYKMVKLAWVLN